MKKKEPERQKKVRAGARYGTPAKLVTAAVEARVQKMKEWAEKSKKVSGLVGQSEPRF